MRYASIGGGVDPDLTPTHPKLGTIGAKSEVWARAADAAARFWSAAHHGRPDVPASKEFQDLAAKNLAAAREFVHRCCLPGSASR